METEGKKMTGKEAAAQQEISLEELAVLAGKLKEGQILEVEISDGV